MTAPISSAELADGPPLNHDFATERAHRQSEWCNLARCYLSLLAERDALRAQLDEMDGLSVTSQICFDKVFAERDAAKAALTEAVHRCQDEGMLRVKAEERVLAAEAALSAYRISQKETGHHDT